MLKKNRFDSEHKQLSFLCWICLLHFLFFINVSKAQESIVLEEQNFIYECDCRNWADGLFLSVGTSLLNELKIDEYLVEIGAPSLSTAIFWFGLGWSFRSEENLHSLDFIVSLGEARSTNDIFQLNHRENDIMLRYYRKILASETGSFFSFGVQTSYMLGAFSLSSKNTVIDLNQPYVETNSLNFTQNAWMIGPSISFNWVKGEKQKLIARFLISYDFSVFSSPWEVAQATTLSSFKETRDRLQLSLIFPLLTR